MDRGALSYQPQTGASVSLSFQQSKRYRRLSLRFDVYKRKVILNYPYGVSRREAQNFLEQHHQWLEKQIAKAILPIALCCGAVIPFRGKDHLIVYDKMATRVVKIINDKTLPELCLGGEELTVSRRILRFFYHEAEQDITQKTQKKAHQLGAQFGKIRIKEIKSRWGSCSSKRNLNFSWRLILAPPYVLDYLVAHEVAHLREMNHSPRFWALVDELTVYRKQAEEFLKREGASLHSIGAK